ncbi:DNA-binding protein [Opitutaceae bacterium TAV5]|nr:DNA-binding protein [Opitutaceae bacterium TAV5]
MKWLLDNDVFFAAVNTAHEHHETSRAWLDGIKAEGWGVSVETFLAAVRLLMNPKVMQNCELPAAEALRVIRAEFTGKQAGRIVSGGEPEDAFLKKATGHKQVMDFYLVQTAMNHGARLATRDRGTLSAWNKVAFRVA